MNNFTFSISSSLGSCNVSITGPVTVTFTPVTNSTTTNTTPTVQVSNDLQLAQAFVADLAVGLNIERGHWNDLSYLGTPIANTTAYWAYLRTLGVTHVRFFIPYGFSQAGTQVSQAVVQSFMVPISNAIKAGLKVLLDLTDVLQLNEASANATAIEAYLKMAAGIVAAQNFPKNKIAIGSVNEPAGDSNPNWAPYLNRYHDILRAALPGYTLIAPCANWDYYGKGLNNYDNSAGLYDTTPLADLNVIYQIHDYDPSTTGASPDLATTWANAGKNCAAWSAANGNRPVICGEYGWTDAAGIIAAAQGMGALRPIAWTITSGTGGRVNVSATDATIPVAIAQAIAIAAAYIRGTN